jgi:hypothetical protein
LSARATDDGVEIELNEFSYFAIDGNVLVVEKVTAI